MFIHIISFIATSRKPFQYVVCQHRSTPYLSLTPPLLLLQSKNNHRDHQFKLYSIYLEKQSTMASSDENPPSKFQALMETEIPPGEPLTVSSQMLDKGAALLQSLKPVKQMHQHVCTFALFSHDMSRQIQTHHYVTRLNQDFLQCAVYDSDAPNAKLIGIEYIVSDKVFEDLDVEEQKLWHSHAYEIKSGLWVNPGVPEMMQRSELQNLSKSYGKFWCTWQIDRGDVLPLGAPCLMMSPQGVNLGMVKPEKVKGRDEKYKISSDDLKKLRVEIAEPEWINPQADYWKKAGKGFAIDIEPTDMKLRAPFP